MYPRRFARIRPSGKVSNAAKIFVDSKTPIIDCRIVDYSAGGACIEIWGDVKLPERFDLIFGLTKKRCRIVWKAGRRFGLVF